MIRTEWQADAEDIRPLVGAEQAVVHRLLAQNDLEEADRWIARLAPEGESPALVRWTARRTEAQARLQAAEAALATVH
jgi:hypothetical protein